MLKSLEVQGNLSLQDTEGFPGTLGTPRDSRPLEAEGNDKDWPHHVRTSPNYVQHMEKGLLDRETKHTVESPTDDLNDLGVNTAIWGIFMSVTLRAAVVLG